MGIEVVFIASCIIWAVILLYLLYLHLQQRKLSKTAAQLYEAVESLKNEP